MAWKAIRLGRFTLQETSLGFRGQPTLAEAGQAGLFLRNVHGASPWWLGDWMRYIRARWPDRYPQLLGETGYDEDTLSKFAWVCEKVPPARRALAREGVPFTIFEAVAALPPTKQMEVLQRAKAGQLTVSEVRQRVRQFRRRPLESGQATLSGQFRVVLADPDYEARPLEAVAAVPLAAHTLPNSALFLWCPERLRFAIKSVLDMWGFEHRAALIWDRVIHEGPHAYLDITHEHLLVATRGQCPPDRPTPMIDSVQTYRGPSRPPEFRKLIERLYDGPYLELYPGDTVPKGWTGYGPKLVRATA